MRLSSGYPPGLGVATLRGTEEHLLLSPPESVLANELPVKSESLNEL